MIGLINVYIALSFGAFAFTACNRYGLYDNYFAFALSYWAEPITNVILYNFWLATMILFQKVVAISIFTEIKENEKTKILQKLKLKSLQILFMAVILHDQFTFPVYALALGLVVSFVLHHLTVLRSEYLINTHNLYMGEHLRLLTFYLILIFIDFEVLKHSWSWILAQNNMSIVFSFYILQLFLLLLEPCVKFSIYLYERFTGYQFNQLDAKLNIIGFVINLPRLILLNVLGLWIMVRFRFSFFFVFMIIQLIVELVQLLKNFGKIRGLSKMMASLPKITREEIQTKKLDDTCMVCFRQIHEGVLVPSCNHIFHNECLKQWIHKNTNHFCPKCKKPFNFPDKQKQVQEAQVELVEQANLRFQIERMQGQQELVEPDENDIASDVASNNSLEHEHSERLNFRNSIKHPNKGDQQKQDLQQQRVSFERGQKQKSQKILFKKKRAGSPPFGLPQEAIYYRSIADFASRMKIKSLSEGIVRFLDQPQRVRVLLLNQK